MRSSKILSGVSAGVLLALSGGAQAADRDDDFQRHRQRRGELQVSATDLAFGAFDGTADIDSTSTISVNCTNGTPYTIALDVGTGGGTLRCTARSRTAAPGPARWSTTCTAMPRAPRSGVTARASTFTVGGTGTGMATTVDHTVYGRLLAAGNTNAQSSATTRRRSRSPSPTDGRPVRSLIIGLLASAAVAGLPSMPAHAGSFSISPIRLDLSATARSAALTVRNDAQEALVQARSHALGAGRRRGSAHADARPARLAGGIHAAGRTARSWCASRCAARRPTRRASSAIG